jgi:threonine 3-dehydrogenase
VFICVADVEAYNMRIDDMETLRQIGVDMVLEVSGAQQAYDQGLKILRKSGTFVIIGIASKPIQLEIPTNIMYKEAKLFGITGREMYETWYKMTVMLQSGLDINPVITHRFRYDEFRKGFEVMNTGQSAKVILYWT